MKIRLGKPDSYSLIGRKDNQEDFLWPSPELVNSTDRVFIMCDGVGGQEKGEVASKTAATALGTYLSANIPPQGVCTAELFEAALQHAYDALDAVDTSGDSLRKMGTTMTCVVFHKGGALVAHIGDSRIYQLRPSLADRSQNLTGIVYQSEDHSLVNDMLRAGEITEQEAATFPQKNVITRAMQPNMPRRCRADVYNLRDVKAGDYFFLCSDGVLESINNVDLGLIVADNSKTTEQKVLAIKTLCENRSKDNNTCWLIPVSDVESEPEDLIPVADETEVMAEIDDTPEAPVSILPAAEPEKVDSEIVLSSDNSSENKKPAAISRNKAVSQATPSAATLANRKKKQRQQYMIYALCVVLALLIGLIVYSLFLSPSDNKDTDNNTNEVIIENDESTEGTHEDEYSHSHESNSGTSYGSSRTEVKVKEKPVGKVTTDKPKKTVSKPQPSTSQPARTPEQEAKKGKNVANKFGVGTSGKEEQRSREDNAGTAAGANKFRQGIQQNQNPRLPAPPAPRRSGSVGTFEF